LVYVLEEKSESLRVEELKSSRVKREKKDATQRTQRPEHRGHGSPQLTRNKIREIRTEKHCGPFWECGGLPPLFLTTAVAD
jgi:hypothetical protein